MYKLIEKVIFLQDIEVFKEVKVEDLAYLAAIAEEKSFLPEADLYEINDAPDSLFLVIHGRIRLHRNGQEISVIGPREAIGTWALFDNEPRVATATALEETETLRIDRDDFYDLISDHVQIAEAVLRSLTRRLRTLVARFQDVKL